MEEADEHQEDEDLLYQIEAMNPTKPLLIANHLAILLLTVGVAAVIVMYKEDVEGTFAKLLDYMAEKVREKTISLFQANYPDLLP